MPPLTLLTNYLDNKPMQLELFEDDRDPEALKRRRTCIDFRDALLELISREQQGMISTEQFVSYVFQVVGTAGHVSSDN